MNRLIRMFVQKNTCTAEQILTLRENKHRIKNDRSVPGKIN